MMTTTQKPKVDMSRIESQIEYLEKEGRRLNYPFDGVLDIVMNVCCKNEMTKKEVIYLCSRIENAFVKVKGKITYSALRRRYDLLHEKEYSGSNKYGEGTLGEVCKYCGSLYDATECPRGANYRCSVFRGYNLTKDNMFYRRGK